MKTSTSMVAKLKAAAAELKKAAKWNGSRLAVDANSDNYVYELLCYFHVALAAKDCFDIQVAGYIVNGPRKKRVATWPKSPGMKQNFSFLQLTEAHTQNASFQLCPGIKVTDKNGKKRAPDINLLSGNAPDQPTHQNLLACWDAKHRSNPLVRLSDTDVSDFVYTYQQLGQPTPPASWTANLANPTYSKSGLFTNGNESTELDKALDEYGISETNNFPAKPVTRP